MRWRMLCFYGINCCIIEENIQRSPKQIYKAPVQMKRKTGYNPKRRFDTEPGSALLEQIALSVRYGGNPEHKRNPGDFGLTPPAQPRPDKSLCDDLGIFSKAKAERLLQEGARKGMVSQARREGFPQNIWAVTLDGSPVEAQLENASSGIPYARY